MFLVIIMHRIISTIGISSALVLLTSTLIFAQTTSPALKVITPQEGQTIYGTRLPILFSVENFELVDYQTNPSPIAGQGHIHLWLDETNPTRESAAKVIQDSFTFSDVPFGEHTLRAELVTNNHNSLTPPQIVTVTFKNAQLSTPSPAVATSGFDKNTALVILVVVALVIVAAWWYTKEEDEEPKSESKSKVTRKRTSRKSRGKR